MSYRNTDEKLISSLKSIKKEERHSALTSIYESNYDTVSNFVLNNNGTAEDAEDIFQEGVIALYEQVVGGLYKGKSSISTYLYAICKNLWLKQLRRHKLFKAHKSNSVIGESISEIEEEESEDAVNKLVTLLEKAGNGCKRILLLFYYERRSMIEIARSLNYANAQVAKNKKSRCIKKIRLILSELEQ